MQLNNDTLQILKSFSNINPSIYIRKGNVLRTCSTIKTVYAKAVVSQEFEDEMAIYDLSNFLSAISVFDKAEITKIDDKSVRISTVDNKRSFNYLFANPSSIVYPPEKDLVLKNFHEKFNLTQKSISDVLKAIGILSQSSSQITEIAIKGDGSVITLQAVDSKKEGKSYSDEVGVTDKVFTAYFKVDNLKFIPNDYEVTLTTQGIANFKAENVEYWVAVEANSKF